MKIVKRNIILIIFLLLLINFLSCKFIEKQYLSEEDEYEDEITTITSDNEDDLRDALLILEKFGGIIYINTPVINIKKQTSLSITGSIQGGIVGIEQENGEYPRLNFKEQRDKVTLLYMAGLTITGSNKLFQNLIIENAGTNGIDVSGQKNHFNHIITRYNGQSGVYLSPGSDANSFIYVYSYRNFHFLDNNLTGDGFTVRVGGNHNIFNFCFAWDNSQNGFGYHFDDNIHKNGTLTYTYCASWNNGNMDVFSGRYDFTNRKELDKNLWTIQQIIKSDETFEDNYNNRYFDINGASINSKPAVEYFSDYEDLNEKEGNGNGFTLGHEKNEQNPLNIRAIDYSVAFDNKLKGYNNNKSQKFTGYVTNSVGFNNKMNYELPYTISKWSNNWGWGSKEDDKFDSDLIVKQPRDTKSAQKTFYNTRDQIIAAVNANTFPDNINFERNIKGLTE